MMEYNSNFELDEAKSILPPKDGLYRTETKTKIKGQLKTRQRTTVQNSDLKVSHPLTLPKLGLLKPGQKKLNFDQHCQVDPDSQKIRISYLK